jgi:hypothetical protein
LISGSIAFGQQVILAEDFFEALRPYPFGEAQPQACPEGCDGGPLLRRHG